MAMITGERDCDTCLMNPNCTFLVCLLETRMPAPRYDPPPLVRPSAGTSESR